MSSRKQPEWQPVMSVAQLKPGTVVRDRKFPAVVQTIEFRRGRLIRFADHSHTTVAASKRFLDFQAA